MYKPETIRRYQNSIRAAVEELLALSDEEFAHVRTVISAGDRKIGRTRNVSQAPGYTCGNCSGCIWHCYDIKACLRLPAVMRARAVNTALAIRDRDRYFEDIARAVTGQQGFRWHQGGEIPDYDYLLCMVTVAEGEPDCRQWGYTHRHDLVNAYLDVHGALPGNLSIMYSYEGTEPAEDNPHGMPEFRCIDKGQEPPVGMMQCPGNCAWCLEHHRGCPWGESAWTWKH